MSKKFFGLDIDFMQYDEVVIKCAEVPAVIVGIRLDSDAGVVEYLIEYTYGSFWQGDFHNSLTGSYENDCCYVLADEITLQDKYFN